jgi:methylated-DNA-[protein]-cysteine S-methyltransferase
MHNALPLLKKIPKGRVVTYSELARACNTSPRAVGTIMRNNKEPDVYPCYKVVASSGALAGYSAIGGVNTKRKLLERDGVRLDEKGRVNEADFYIFK